VQVEGDSYWLTPEEVSTIVAATLLLAVFIQLLVFFPLPLQLDWRSAATV